MFGWMRRNWLPCATVYIGGLALTWVVDSFNSVTRFKQMAVFNAMYYDAEWIDVPHDIASVTSDPLPYQIGVRGSSASTKPPVLLLHGTPGAGFALDDIALSLTGDDRQAIWFDLPGFASQAKPWLYDDYSASTYGDIVLAIMDAMDIERAHIVGWSNGGAVALRMAEQDESRLASITLLGSVGAQDTEGSGSYLFEHAKYQLGYALLVWGGKVIPHFGLPGPPPERVAFLRNFDDTDQRPLAGIMRNLRTPTLILHGRDDFLVADWAAEYHHELMPTSTLVMTDDDHFMPFLAAEETADHIDAFIERFDDPAAEPTRVTLDLAPRVRPFGETVDALLGRLHFTPWWLLVPMIVCVARFGGLVGISLVCVLVGATEIDIGVAWLGLCLAGVIGVVHRKKSKRIRAWLRAVFGALAAIGVGFVFVQIATRPLIRLAPDWLHGLGWIAAICALASLLFVLPKIWTTRGRQRIKASLARLLHHEWWPGWALYLPLVPWFVLLSVKHRHPLAFTACNPGIANGGGLAGESKAEIMDGLLASGDDRVLFAAKIDALGPPTDRAERANELVRSEPRLGGFPIVAKPDAGEQGRGVRVCAGADELRAFFVDTPGPVVLQRYDPGPFEIGVFYVRERPDSPGRVFSITRKDFPELTGDGTRTIEELIWDHKRYRCQGDSFCERFRGRLREVLPAGETLTLTKAGNHRQGCIFRDGSDLLTPELERAVCEIATGFVGISGGGLDYGRFDVRGPSLEAIQRGAFTVVEVNGVTSESTTIYDPARSPVFAWATLAEQWAIAYEIGSHNRRAGHKPLSLGAAMQLVALHLRERKGLVESAG